ncbi:cell surface glycoprotein CD200 receptor 1-B isoform X1 [Takifugu rubripes]|uniref:cell surface glycoprotein CD200 receptor 1-B isoform X1 n=1 Tax=Takifugu rubripes TaxID=31033 RepID=UPI0011451FD2|nr:cell surface glycoprotein CD200 receptor 1 isoform X1 [Takifugu rubripes]
MDVKWILAAFLPLLTEVLSTEKAPLSGLGTNQSSAVAYTSPPPFQYVRNATFNLGSDVNLTCSNRTWNTIMFVVWNINLTNPPKLCRIAFDFVRPLVDTCRDGKSLHNTSRGQSYLHIPNLSNDDVGIYKCESVYTGGNEVHMINMDITVPPSLSAWLESEGEKMVAVCRAERAKPAANISWSQAGSIVETLLEDGGFFSVESRLELLEGADTENLTCVIDHPYWRDQQILQPALKRGRIPWITIITIVSVFVLLGGVLFYVQKKVVMRYYQQSDGSETKTAPTEEMEEVEPYASYVQRVNSLYNSSAVMFT